MSLYFFLHQLSRDKDTQHIYYLVPDREVRTPTDIFFNDQWLVSDGRSGTHSFLRPSCRFYETGKIELKS